MTTTSVVLCLFNILCAAIFIAMAIPLIRRRVKMNRSYGVKIAKAFSSEENWYKINEYGGRRLVFWSCLLVPVAVGCLFLPACAAGAAALQITLPLALAPLLAVILATIEIFRYSNKL